jgi:cell fate (sporulation/competence/biofilm development) regulator YlbF (YheA/YmcA/DUF963 family)
MTALSPAIQNRLDDLGRAILSEPQFEGLRLRVEQFLINDEARAQYVRVSEQGEHLHHKQSQGVQLDETEVAEFEKQREALIGNPVARGFLEAQEELQGIQESINRFIGKTLELGRLPGAEDLRGGGCGSGCGCHHEH